LLRLHPDHPYVFQNTFEGSSIKIDIPLHHSIKFPTYKLPERDGRCVQDLVTNSPYRAGVRLLMIPPSYSQVSENNQNDE